MLFRANFRSSIFSKDKYSDRKSTRLNSSHVAISYAVFSLQKKKRDGAHLELMMDQHEKFGPRLAVAEVEDVVEVGLGQEIEAVSELAALIGLALGRRVDEA